MITTAATSGARFRPRPALSVAALAGIFPGMSETPRIDAAQVRHVARLSRLHLSDDQLAQFTEQLGEVLDYVDKLSELDTTDVEPLATAMDMTNVLRQDAAETGLTNEQALHNAPDQSPPYFKVPKVIGDSDG